MRNIFHGNIYSILLTLLIFISIEGCKNNPDSSENKAPVITSIDAFPANVQLADSFAVICSAYDTDRDTLFYDWSCTSGATIKGADTLVPFYLTNTKENIRIFYAPDAVDSQITSIRIDCDVRDGKGGVESTFIYVGLLK